MFLKWAIPGLFLLYFRSFQTSIQLLQQINVKKIHLECGTGIRNNNLLEMSLQKITPRPRLLPKGSQSVRPDWAIYCTFGNDSKPLATINLPKSPTFLGNFCKGVKIIHFCREIIFGQLYRHLYFTTFDKLTKMFTCPVPMRQAMCLYRFP